MTAIAVPAQPDAIPLGTGALPGAQVPESLPAAPFSSRRLPRLSLLQRARACRHRSGISESTLMRARTSSERLLSWLDVDSMA